MQLNFVALWYQLHRVHALRFKNYKCDNKEGYQHIYYRSAFSIAIA